MREKRLRVISLLMLLVMLISGCGSTANVEFDKYGNVLVDYRFYVSEKEYKNMIYKDAFFYTFDNHLVSKATPYYTTEVRDGTLYYVYKYDYKEKLNNGFNYESIARAGKIGTDELTTYGCLIDTRLKFLSPKEYFKYNKDVFAELTITFKEKILETNGVLSNKGYTVTWTRDNMNNYDFLYAYSQTYLDTSIPWIDVKDDDKTFIKRTSEKDKVYFFSILPFKEIKEGNIDILSKGEVKYKDGVYRFHYKWYEGKHNKIKCLNKNGGFYTQIWVDKTKPHIKFTGSTYKGCFKEGVKLTVTDNLSGVKDIRLNNRSVKNGYKIKKRGSYTVYAVDNFGNYNEIMLEVVKK